MLEFIQEYFISPIYSGEGYNTYNTLVYGLALGIGLILVEQLILKLKIHVNRAFLTGVFPFLMLASSLRSLVDAEIFPRTAFFITPGIFITTAILAIVSLLISLKIDREGYHRYMGGIGFVLLLYPLSVVLLNLSYWMALLQILTLTALSSVVIYIVLKALDIPGWTSPWVFAIFAGHMLDASATIVAVEYYGYFEEHVFENWLINMVGTAYVLYPAKLAVLGIIVGVINHLIEGPIRNYWYFAFFVLGFSPGLRDAFTIILIG